MKMTKNEKIIYEWAKSGAEHAEKAADHAESASVFGGVSTTILMLGAAILFFAGLTINEKLDRIPKDCPSAAVTYYHSFSNDFSN